MLITYQEINFQLQTSLLGEIYQAVRMITFTFDEEKKHLNLFIYLDRKINESDYEHFDVVACEFESHFPLNSIEKFDIFIEHDDRLLGDIIQEILHKNNNQINCLYIRMEDENGNPL